MTVVEPWTVKRLLEWTAQFLGRKGIDPPRLSSELLLSHVLGVPRIKLYTDHERVLGDDQLSLFRDLVKRAGEQEPIAYLTGKAHFFNLEFKVTRDVLIPRPDTETLVENVLQLARRTAGFESPRVADICTGSGCIAAAIAKHLPHATVTATEISPAALAVARDNFNELGLASRIELLEGDLLAPLSASVDPHPFDMMVSNPPYIATGKMATLDRSVRDYEPHLALDGGEDGLRPHAAILRDAPPRLRSGGRLFLEIAFDQGPAALELARAADGFADARVLRDYAGHDRVIAAIRS